LDDKELLLGEKHLFFAKNINEQRSQHSMGRADISPVSAINYHGLSLKHNPPPGSRIRITIPVTDNQRLIIHEIATVLLFLPLKTQVITGGRALFKPNYKS
jgi:hypothetical protein